MSEPYQFTLQTAERLRMELVDRSMLYLSKTRAGKTQMHVDALIRQIYFLKASLHCALVAQTETNIAAIRALGFKKAARVVKGTDDTPEKVAAF